MLEIMKMRDGREKYKNLNFVEGLVESYNNVLNNQKR